MDSYKLQSELTKIEQAISNVKNLLTGEALNAALEPLQEKKAILQAQIAGDNSIINSIAHRDIVTGRNNSIYNIINQYAAVNGIQSDPDTLQARIVDYLNWMIDRHGSIELRGIKREGQQVVQLELQKVYVPLEAETYQVEGKRNLELDQILRLGNRIVITGGPGSGKTTVLLHLAWALTRAIVADDPASIENKLGLNGVLPLPIFIPLSAYAMYLRQLEHASAREKTLAAFISHYLIENETSFELPENFFVQLLREGQSVILLLDGLDEVPDDNERARVRQAIENLVTGRRDRMRVVVTCRTAAYNGRSALGKEFKEVKVKSLREEHLTAMVEQAYTALYPNNLKVSQHKAAELLADVSRLEAERRYRFGEKTEALISNPLMVRMLLIVHYGERRLPDQRAELYMKATDAMLLPGYAPDVAVANQIGGMLGGSPEIHRELIQHLAFAMHQRGSKQGREISEDDLRQILFNHPSYASLCNDFINLTRQRGTLLEERLGTYHFIHLAFQEFLTARYLAEIVRGEAGVNGIAEFLESGPILDSWWREPILLTIGYLSVTSPQTAQTLVCRIAGLNDKTSIRNQSLSAEVQVSAVEIATMAILEWSNVPETLKTDLSRRLVSFFTLPELFTQASPIQRGALGNALARLGDPRSGVTLLKGMDFCYIPAGVFWMGSSEQDELASDDEQPLRRINIPYNYWMSRYPITVGQFREFVKKSGHKLEKDSLGNLPNHPVVNVCWYDALAFCRWLTEQWKPMLPSNYHITLPSEAEWEKSARGGLEIPDSPDVQPIEKMREGRSLLLQENVWPLQRYPWGNDVDLNRANYDTAQIGATSTVGVFPTGQSPYGCEEMSGNVFEWCSTKWEDDYKDYRDDNDLEGDFSRVARGGAFSYSMQHTRCAFRYVWYPSDRLYFQGFRIAIAPVSRPPILEE